MSVVLRCPNCGTTQATAGECDACHEAQVRYFCTNHEPGVWLSGPTCPQCEARAAATARPPALPSRSRTAAPDLRPSGRPLWEKLLRGAVLARTAPTAAARREHAPAPLGPASGWLMRLVLRLVLIAVLLVVALAGGLYLLARSID